MASRQQRQSPKVHILLGNPGYPVRMLSMQGTTHMTIEHYEAGIRVGDALVIGTDLDKALTFVVLANARTRPERWRAQLKRVAFVSVAGEVHYCER